MTAVVCELANMICGSVLSRIESAADIRLGTPCLLTDPEVAPGVQGDAAAHRVELYGGALTVVMIMDSPTRVTTAP